MATLLVRVRKLERTQISISNGRIHKVWCICVAEYYLSPIKRNEHVTTTHGSVAESQDTDAEQNSEKWQLVYSDRKRTYGYSKRDVGAGRGRGVEGAWENFGGLWVCLFIILMVVIVSWVQTYTKMYQIVRFEYVQCIVYRLYLNKAV